MGRTLSPSRMGTAHSCTMNSSTAHCLWNCFEGKNHPPPALLDWGRFALPWDQIMLSKFVFNIFSTMNRWKHNWWKHHVACTSFSKKPCYDDSKRPCYNVSINHSGKDVKHEIYNLLNLMEVQPFLHEEELEERKCLVLLFILRFFSQYSYFTTWWTTAFRRLNFDDIKRWNHNGVTNYN